MKIQVLKNEYFLLWTFDLETSAGVFWLATSRDDFRHMWE